MASGPSKDIVTEENGQFESRKREHIELSLLPDNQATGRSGLDEYHLPHCAMPEIDWNEISIESSILGAVRKTPFLISSMTAGHHGSVNLNERLALAASRRGWIMGVGSQRKELFDEEAHQEWVELRKTIGSELLMVGNIGLSQVIQTPPEKIQDLVDSLKAIALFVHTNPLQEALQVEGTPYFKGGFESVARLSQILSVPVILKETGCGFSASTLQQANELGIYAVDVAGFGGTHWGRIEGGQNGADALKNQAAKTFANWGVSTYQSLLNARGLDKKNFAVWASGGIRSGLDAAKCISLGAECVGFAKPLLDSAVQSQDALEKTMEALEFELKVALFCTGSRSVNDLKKLRV